MSRLFDVIAVVIVAAVLLVPEPSIDASPAAQGDSTDLFRMSALEDALYRNPDDVRTAVELARTYLAVEQPAWALATLSRFMERGDHEVHRVAAYAYATLLLPAQALAEAERGLKACEAAGCSEVARTRLTFLAGMMRKQVEAGVDPRKDPLRARRLVQEAMHMARPPAK